MTESHMEVAVDIKKEIEIEINCERWLFQ